MIIVTGGAGFIGSALISALNQKGYDNIIVVDDLQSDIRWSNLMGKSFVRYYQKHSFLDELNSGNLNEISFIYHMGACSSTSETNLDYLIKNNYEYSIELFQYAAKKHIPICYASSAATYGNGDQGFSDEHQKIVNLRPLNPYGFSKQLFDLWVLKQKNFPPFWCGLKFFNVYGPNEYHKGSQASVVFHAYPQVKKEHCLKLFKSYDKNYKDGEQKRDFIYVKDVTSLMSQLYEDWKNSECGIYNLGSGNARSFIDLGQSVFSACGFENVKFEWVEMPSQVKKHYQYFTQAEMGKIKSGLNWNQNFTSLEDGISDYVNHYLKNKNKVL